MAEKQWGLRKEEEDEYRRKLLVAARKGDVEAENELMTKYGMRVYSDAERSKMPTYHDSGKKGSPPSRISSSTRASAEVTKAPSQGAEKSTPKANSKKSRPRDAKVKRDND
jgi:hypothetical protein